MLTALQGEVKSCVAEILGTFMYGHATVAGVTKVLLAGGKEFKMAELWL